ncbi:hypothetical protein ABK040_000512 [Willaertia magna]
MVRTIQRISNKQLKSDNNDDGYDDIKEILKEYNTKLLSTQNNKEIKEKLNNLYKNDEPLVKVWISQYQRNSKIVKEENDNVTLQKQLKELTLDLKYEIISFIPTYSNTYSLSNKINLSKKTEQLLNPKSTSIFNTINDKDEKPRNREEEENKKKKMLKVMELLLEPNNVKEECKFSIDSKLVTFHKMRLINKEFNRRMKLKILTLDHLNLDFILREGIINTDFNLLRNELILKKLKLWKLMNLLKHQRIYNEYKKNIDCNNGHIMKTILQLDHVSLYNNEPFDNFFNENKNNSTLHFTEFDFIPLIDRASSVDFDSNNDYELIDYEEEEDDTLEKEEKKFIDVNSLDIFELSNKDLNDLEQQLTKDFKNLQSKEKSNNSKRITFEKTIEDPEYSQSYYNASPVGFLLTSNHFYPYPSSNALKPKITEFIGDNNTIKSIQFNCNLFNSYILKEDLKLMLNCLKNLTTINYINYNESINAHPFRTTPTNISSLPSVKEVNIIFIDNYQFSFVTSLVKSQEIQQFENLERINIFPLYDNGWSDLKEAVKSELQPIIQSVYSETTVNNSFVFIEKNPITNENIVYYKIIMKIITQKKIIDRLNYVLHYYLILEKKIGFG